MKSLGELFGKMKTVVTEAMDPGAVRGGGGGTRAATERLRSPSPSSADAVTVSPIQIDRGDSTTSCSEA